jgi:hypothetical protein
MVTNMKETVARAERRVRESQEIIERSLRLHQECAQFNRQMRMRIHALRLQLQSRRNP